jgi:DNA-(apurinic or apyrimidinic site) lyase (EC 4.2.99.18)/endonuclease III (EC 3.2.2.-)
MKTINEIIKILEKEYPVAKTVLNFSNPLEILVATILSAQCTDERVNKVTKELFKKYKTVDDYANANLKKFEQEIKSTGFYKMKAKNIINSAKIIKEKFSGKVPDTMENLITLPGVARKTANVVLGNAYGKVEGIVVDTHVRRLAFRIGLTKNTDPNKIEQDLMKLVPKDKWMVFSYLLIDHGRKICSARKPLCEQCVIEKFCSKNF